ncbi:ComEA family DNA-binding protein [Mycetocola reblochoni]|uniref:ComEA family DNA-binding protein n=2 Tax=Mycetocola reblochoni TaxID=331618 RepID=A0A3L6ZPN9_9MICO|nr:ComEA family DNA-binding protein [Mycetocola reblochoni]RLP69903.1 ComEA family DNA-binding protein [Mycetocola reblochoni]SJN30374.1 putative DNA-binding protein [Mycetocola reblochoni REB411]
MRLPELTSLVPFDVERPLGIEPSTGRGGAPPGGERGPRPAGSDAALSEGRASTGAASTTSGAGEPTRRRVRELMRHAPRGRARAVRRGLLVLAAAAAAIMVGVGVLAPLLIDADDDGRPDARGTAVSAPGAAGADTDTDTTGSHAGPAATVSPTDALSAAVPGPVVYVVGAVREPGIYTLDEGARVGDAVESAGGLADDADELGVNLARPVTDGEQIVVTAEGEPPGPSAAGAQGQPGAAAPAGGGGAAAVSLSTADAATLETLPGVGPATAEQIIAHRESIGGFTAVEQLLDVSGIGEAKFAQIEPRVVL